MVTTLRRKKRSLRKVPFLYSVVEIAVGGGHDAHVHFDFLIAADGADFFFLEKAQSLACISRGKFADLVEENGSGIGRLQQALLGAKGAREGPFS
jgi:1,4-dihydroxy-2-naphthoyl-CoA synthase